MRRSPVSTGGTSSIASANASRWTIVPRSSVTTIPLIRERVAWVLARSRFDPTSHTGRALRTVLETFPRDVIFEIDRDELWQRYRQAALYAYIATLITAGMGGMQNENIAMEGLGRAVSALEDLDTVSALKASL